MGVAPLPHEPRLSSAQHGQFAPLDHWKWVFASSADYEEELEPEQEPELEPEVELPYDLP